MKVFVVVWMLSERPNRGNHTMAVCRGVLLHRGNTGRLGEGLFRVIEFGGAWALGERAGIYLGTLYP